MQDVGFFVFLVGVESPDTDTLKTTRKRQNRRRSIAKSIKKVNSYGMVANCGYIIGFDSEKGSVSQNRLDLIEACAAPVNMVGLSAYFNRIVQMVSGLNCRQKKLRLPLRVRLRELRAFGRLIWRMGVKKD